MALLLVGGVFADRLSRRRLMVSADALRAATAGFLAVLLLAGAARVWQLIVLFAVYGAADAFFHPPCPDWYRTLCRLSSSSKPTRC